MAREGMPIGELLVESKALTRDKLDEVLKLPREAGKKLGQVLVERGFVTEAQVTQSLSYQLSVPWVSLYHIEFSRQLLSRVPRHIAERHCLVPIYIRHVKGVGDTLYVAIEDPTNQEGMAETSKAASLPVRPMIASASDIRSAIRVYYGSIMEVEAVEVLSDAPAAAGPSAAVPSAAGPSTAIPSAAVPSAPSPSTASSAEKSAPNGSERRPEPPPLPKRKPNEPSGGAAALAQLAPPSTPSAPSLPAAPAMGLPTPPAAFSPAFSPLSAPVSARPPSQPPQPSPLGTARNSSPSIARAGSSPGITRPGSSPNLARPGSSPNLARPGSSPGIDPQIDSPDAAPEVEAREIAVPGKRGPRMVALTLLDGTSLQLPARPRRRSEPAPPLPGALPDQLTSRDLIAALRAHSHGADVSEILGDDVRWEAMFAALLSVLLKKGVIADWEFIDELRKV